MNWELTLRVLETIFGWALTIVAAVSWVWGHIVRPRDILMKWGQENEFEMLSFTRAFLGGAFGWFSSSPIQIVYSVTVLTKEGKERSGWVRCGSFGGGAMFSDQTEVIWSN